MTLRTVSAVLLKCDFGKAPKLTGMQPLPLLRFQFIERVEADLEMLADPPTVEFASHSGELDLSMQRFPRRRAKAGFEEYLETKALVGL